MARGRKRLMAGWGLVGIGAVLAAMFVTSRWFGASLTLPGGRSVELAWGAAHINRMGPMYPGAPWPEVGPWQTRANTLDPRFLAWWVRNGGQPNFWIGVVRFDRKTYPDFFRERTVIVLWPFALTATGAGAALVLFVRRKYRQAWLCPTCRYDLRGLGPGTPCPECGPRGSAKA